ncbi:hypothetical protein BGX21_010368 [Mortierella sp. AD011]|nr:hypothetical protein BGX21_010368 [Mortierella sp. AD011]
MDPFMHFRHQQSEMASAYVQDQFPGSVLGTEEDTANRNSLKIPAARGAATGDPHNSGYGDSNSVPPGSSPTQYGHSHHHSHLHPGHTHHGSKSSTSSPHIDRAERGDGDGSREHKHKKKKKKRKHEHDHDHTHHEGEGDSEHRKKKKRKKEREGHGEYGEHGEFDIA